MLRLHGRRRATFFEASSETNRPVGGVGGEEEEDGWRCGTAPPLDRSPHNKPPSPVHADMREGTAVCWRVVRMCQQEKKRVCVINHPTSKKTYPNAIKSENLSETTTTTA